MTKEKREIRFHKRLGIREIRIARKVDEFLDDARYHFECGLYTVTCVLLALLCIGAGR
ncbi:MAG: hypothetical protein IJT82_03465 [Schwartzia sp.]|nr:hypothetical protein [Schwartzia sp. (in: firmicutes)]